MKVGYIGGFWSTNIGNAFYNLGAIWLLEKIYGKKNVFFIPDPPQVYWNSLENDYDLIPKLGLDLVIISGPILGFNLEQIYGNRFDEITRNGGSIGFVSVGAVLYSEKEADSVSAFLNKYNVSFVFTRDSETYNLYAKRLNTNVFDGLCASMFLNDAVLEPFGTAVFTMSICATTALNAFLAIGFFVGLGLSGFSLVDWIGNVSTARLGAVFAAIALALMLLSASSQSLPFLHFALTIFGVSLGICIHSSFTLMFTFVQPGRVGLLLGVWGALYAYSRGLATISGGGLLTLFKTLNGGDVFGAYSGVFCLQIVGFLAAAVLMRRLDVTGFRRSVQSRFGDFMQSALD